MWRSEPSCSWFHPHTRSGACAKAISYHAAVPATRIIGLTGGIASGKSTVARHLAELGVPVVDADRLAREVVEPGQPALTELVGEFGADILNSDGTLDRKRLGAIVFADPGKRARLNAITHPRIAAQGQAEIARHVTAGVPLVIYEAPLIVENGLHLGLGGLIVVSLPEDVQLERVMRAAVNDG